MTDQSDVRRIALALPETVESADRFAFGVRNREKLEWFVWAWLERTAPRQPRAPRADVIAVRVLPKKLVKALDDRAAKPGDQPSRRGRR